MAMEKLTLSTQLVNAILQYLGTKPYTEVAQLIAGIQQEAQAQAQPEKVVAEAVN
jgi:hypothetical protein